MGLILLTILYFCLEVIHFFLTVPPFVGERNNARCKDAAACGRISLSSIAHPSSFCRLHNVLCTSCVCHHCVAHFSRGCCACQLVNDNFFGDSILLRRLLQQNS